MVTVCTPRARRLGMLGKKKGFPHGIRWNVGDVRAWKKVADAGTCEEHMPAALGKIEKRLPFFLAGRLDWFGEDEKDFAGISIQFGRRFFPAAHRGVKLRKQYVGGLSPSRLCRVRGS